MSPRLETLLTLPPPFATKPRMKAPKLTNRNRMASNAKTLTETREGRDQEPDMFYRKNNRGNGRAAPACPHCFIQLFQEPTDAELSGTLAVKTSTATREAREQEKALTTRASKTNTRTREEIDQDEGYESYFAIPKC
jgi:hypothetical protein